MSTKTIHGTVIEVMKIRGGNASLDEIVGDIVSNNLYAFKVKQPRAVIRQSIRRRCQGETRLDKAGKPLFKEISPQQYELI
ncbi:MAG: hypothetical protein QF444_05165 [Phycisphaerales bacterium]|nr:hypothetical protein [Phycisphaerales bacterium]